MQGALAAYNKKYNDDYAKAIRKLDGMVWYEPSGAERKAIVAKQRVGKELAYAPTGTSLDAGKLMKVADLEKQEARRRELEEAKKAIEIQKAELEKSTRNGKTVPVPAENPLPRPVEPAAVEQTAAKKSFWGGLFASGGSDGATSWSLLQRRPSMPLSNRHWLPRPGRLAPKRHRDRSKPATQARATTEAAPAAQQGVAGQATASKGFWGRLFSKNGDDARKPEPLGVAPADIAVQQPAGQKPVPDTAQRPAAIVTAQPADAEMAREAGRSRPHNGQPPRPHP